MKRLPPRPRARLGPYELIPDTTFSGRVIRGRWCLPGGVIETTAALEQRAKRNGWRLQIID